MFNRNEKKPRAMAAERVTDAPSTRTRRAGAGTGFYRPSQAFRLLADRYSDDRPEPRVDPDLEMRSAVAPAPAPLQVLAAAIVVGLVAGLAEIAILLLQIRVLHVVDWSTLMIGRHAVWMVPCTSIVLCVGFSLTFVGPVLCWAADRRRRGSPACRGRAWGWSGTVLGTFLFLGPLLAVRGFHVAAPLALSIGLGYRIRRWVVRPTPAWRRGVYRAAALSVAVLLAGGTALFGSMGRPGPTATTSTGDRSPNLLWIVLDTLARIG